MALGQENDNFENLAWLCDSQRKKVLRPRARGASPRSGRLCFFAPDFALHDPKPWYWGEELSDLPPVGPDQAAYLVHCQLRRTRLTPDEKEFARLHQEILQHIASGEFAKVVPVVYEEFESSTDIRPSLFARGWTIRPEQTAFGLSYGGQGICGLTPEILFSVSADGRLETMALAGTAAADGTDLLADTKERREHDLVIENILSALKTLPGAEALAVGPTGERVFGRLKHLLTSISLQLAEKPDFAELVRRLHPTAALGGWPRRPALDWLEKQPFHRARNRFGAPFGIQDKEGSMRCVVAIRSVQWAGRHVRLSAGCGVVEGSQASREWDELNLKRSAVRENLGLPL